MSIISKVLIALVAVEHFGFLAMEMFLWRTPGVMRTFGTTAAFAEESKAMAANQGLYNGFLAAGLLWALLYPDPLIGRQIALFFAGCVVVAAVYGGITVKRSILIVQGLPALLAIISLLVTS